MEDKVIIAVCGYPELYDTSSYFHRNRNKKDLAWKKVSEEEVCRKKWKSLRDTYLKERRKETEKRSGSAAGSGKKWKYSAVLSFLDPFVSPRETSGNMEREDEENQAAGYEHPEDQGETEEDELFLLSLVPTLQKLPPQTKEFVKFQIHKLIYERDEKR
uniref:Transcription factor Adf-1 n=1 Tax=Cyprinus carpio TaxID=7962 RepID=A0A8C1V1U2_CYPCA